MTKESLWESVLSQIQLDISEMNYKTWFKGTNISSIDDKKVVISVPSTFAIEWIKGRYHKNILKTIKNINKDIREIDYTVNTSNYLNEIKKEKEKKDVVNVNQMEFVELSTDYETGLNSKYTFDNFIVGPFNELAHAAGFAVTENPGSIYNPLFIYSKTGLGKTHLLQSIGNKIKDNSNKKVFYVTAQKFISEIISAIRSNNMDNLKYQYKDIDVLIIDDIQFLSGKEKTQEEFFHTFNDLYEKNKQIILSSDRHPKSISSLADRLKSRFEGGMITDIDYPDTETRAAILKSKAQEKDFFISDEICYYIAENIQRNIRELEGFLNKLIIQKQVREDDIRLDNIKKIFKDINKLSSNNISFSKILKSVSNFYDITEKDIIGKSRKKEIVKSRQIIIYLLRKDLKYSYPYIAKKIGGKDHTTIMHSYKKIENELKENKEIKEEIQCIKEDILSV